MFEIERLIQELAHPGMLFELLALSACLGAAWGLCWLMGRRESDDSVWFGRPVIAGLMFPLLALALLYGSALALGQHQRVVLLKLALPILISLAGIRFLARVLKMVFPRSKAARLIEGVFSWLAWIAAVLWIMGLLPALLDRMETLHVVLGKSRVSALGVLQGLLSAGVVIVLTLWLSAVLERHVIRGAVQDLSLRKVATNAVRAVLLLVGLLFALSSLGVDMTALSVLGGALGVGIGFGLQKLASNYVSGFVILFERSLRIGDTVRVDNFEGTVTDIKTRYTLIRSVTGIESIVPNEKLITERIENLSLADPNVVLSTDVTVSYGADVVQVMRILEEAAFASPRVLRDPPPGARLAQFAPDGLQFTLLFWIADPAAGQLNVRSEINLAILRGLNAAGVEIPYPQRVVRIVR